MVITHIKEKDRKEISEVLSEIEEERQEERLEEWENDAFLKELANGGNWEINYCPECGDNSYVKGYKCQKCDFPHPEISGFDYVMNSIEFEEW